MAHMKWVEEDFASTERRDLTSIRRVLILTMILNFIATAIKFSAGLITGALSVVADALDSLFDGLSNVVGLGGLYIASRPPDASHPYGHRKFETVGALVIAFLLFLTAWQLLAAAWHRLGSEIVLEISWWMVIALLVSMLIQALTSLYELRQGRRLQSEILVADALHTRASIVVSASVLAGLGLVRVGFPQADPLLAAFVALVIAKIGVDVLRETVPVLVDQAAVDPHRIADVVGDVDGIESFHRVRSRGALGSAAVDLHVRVSPGKSVQEANAIADEVRRRLLALDGVTDVTVHVEPERLKGSFVPDLFATVKQAASELGLAVYELWVHRVSGDLFIEIHVGVDPLLSLGEAHALVDQLEREIQVRAPDVKGVHTHIELATDQVSEGDPATPEIEQKVRREVERVVAQNPALDHPHNLRVLRNPAAEDKLFISFECTIPPEISVAHAHYLASLIEQELSQRLEEVAEVSVHLEPPEDTE